MPAIRLQFVLGSDLSSRFVAWYGQGYGGYSHVDALLPDGGLLGARADVIRGIAPGVQVRPPNYEKWKKRTLIEISSLPEQASAWERWLRMQIGKQYDQGAILGFITGHHRHDRGHWICSAAQAGALRQCGKLHRFDIPDCQVTPNALHLTVTAGLGGFVISHYG